MKRLVPNLGMFRSPLARQLIVAIIITSSTITLCLTALQLYGEYRSELGGIQAVFRQIEEVHLKSLSQSLWATNKAELQLQIEGIVHVPNLEYIEVREGDRIWAQAGHRASGKIIERQYPMTYIHRGQTLEIGMLTVVASLDAVYRDLVKRAFIILASNAFKTFLVAGFAFAFFHWLVNRHLLSIAEYLRGLDLRGRASSLILVRAAGRQPDELDEVAAAINLMHENARSLLTKLHHSETRLRLSIQASSIGLWDWHLATNDVYFSPEWKSQLGFQDEEIPNRFEEWESRMHPEDRERIVADLQAYLASPWRGYCTEFRLRHKDGSYRWIYIQADSICDGAGKPVRMLGCQIDITARKQTERELARKTAIAQLLESLARTANEAATPEEALRVSLRRLCDFGNWTLGRVAMTHELGGDLELSGVSVWHAPDLARHEEFIRISQRARNFPLTGAFVGSVVREKWPAWIVDVKEAQGFLRKAAALADGLRAAFAFPVVVRGEVVAFLEFFADTPRAVDSGLVEASETIAAQLARSVERSRAEQVNAQLASIVEYSNDAIISCSLDGEVLSWNAAAERLFGYTAIEFIGQNAFLLVPPDQLADAGLRFARLKDGNPGESYEAVRLGKNDRRIDVAGTISPIKDASGKMVGASLLFRDISGRKRAAVEHAQLAAIVESSNDAIFSRGADGTILTWNAAAERMFGWSAQEAIGQPVSMLLPPESIRPPGTLIDRALRAELASPVKTTHVRKDGVRIQTQVTFSPVMDQQGNIIAVSNTVRDMSELMRNENALRTSAKRLRELSQRLQEVEEIERHAISRELHDRIGQELSTLTLLFGGLAAKLSAESRRAVHKQLEDIQGLLRSTVENVRDVMAELRPPILDDYGLLAALRHLVTEFSRRSGISVELRGADLIPRLPPIVETAIFRISQEALNNIAKHAQAKKVKISLDSAPERVVLKIADDGVGFDAGNAPQGGKHWGMITMRERAEAVGIVFRLESAPGAGTQIVVEAERATT